MCGIAGVLTHNSEPVELAELMRMASVLEHRGPDEFGAYRDPHIGLAHSRLSIIDLLSGQQPLANEDGTIWVVFNGEIFNFVELRAELEAHGHVFRTKSDTEVIVHAFEQWGPAGFARFNGQFAIGLWEAGPRVLTLARDRIGIHPLYVAESAGRVAFASEVKALFAGNPELPRGFDAVGLEETFTFWSPVAPQTPYRSVREVPPGQVWTYKDGVCSQQPFFVPSYAGGSLPTFRGSVEDAARSVLDELERATALRMLRADVPVGSYLSGGLDSSLMAALGLRAKGSQFKTFSLTFEEQEFDESSFQTEMVQRLGTEHTAVHVKETDIAEHFPTVLRHTEKPLLRTAPVPMFLLSRLARQEGVKVVLTGEGADEVFAGYDIFREARVRRFWAKQPKSEWRPRLLERLYPYLARSPVAQQAFARRFFGQDLSKSGEPGFSHGPRFRSASALKRLFHPDLQAQASSVNVEERLYAGLPAEYGSWSLLSRDQYLEISTLLPGYILSSQGDRMLMANSIEGRFPFLDVNVMALANSLPSSFKLRALDEKHVLKRAARDLVPSGILVRKKQPYRAPDGLCFVGPRAPAWVRDMTTESAVTRVGVFAPKAVSQLFDKTRSSAEAGKFTNADNMAITGVLSTQLLHGSLIESPAAGRDVVWTTLIDRLGGPARS